MSAMKTVSGQPTAAQIRRRHLKNADGKFAKGHRCELCGRAAPLTNYCSLPSVPAGVGLILCGRKSCDRLIAGKTQLEAAFYILRREEDAEGRPPSEYMRHRLQEWAATYPGEAALVMQMSEPLWPPREMPLPLGTKTPWGKVGAVCWTDGERYYMMLDKHGSVALLPASTVEPQVKKREVKP